MRKLEQFFEQLKQKKVAFIGTGVTNNDIMRLFLKKGISITLLDQKPAEKLGAIYTELQQAGVQFELGPTYLDHLERYDVVFRAPGMYYNHPKLQEARQNGVVITTEMKIQKPYTYPHKKEDMRNENMSNTATISQGQEILKIQDEFLRVFRTKDLQQLKRFHRQLDIISEGYRAQAVYHH